MKNIGLYHYTPAAVNFCNVILQELDTNIHMLIKELHTYIYICIVYYKQKCISTSEVTEVAKYALVVNTK